MKDSSKIKKAPSTKKPKNFKSKKYKAFSVQYHPEASPGPHDSHYLFIEFIKEVEKNAKKN